MDGATKQRAEIDHFEHRLRLLIQWFEHFLTVEIHCRIDGLSLEGSLDILKTEIRNLVADKRRHVNELLLIARTLQTQSADSNEVQTLKHQLDQLEHLLNKTDEYVDNRFASKRSTSPCSFVPTCA